LAPIIVDTTLRIGANILQISSLSFIGLGVQPPTAEWGSIMTVGRDYIRDFYPIVTFPGVAIMLTLFGFNLLGDGLRDALDPKLKQ
jgi:peptide/nickel transport system permease protein